MESPTTFEMLELTVEEACKTYGGLSIDNKIMLIDNLSLISRPLIPRRTRCYIVGLCTRGWARYRLGTKECRVRPGDAIIISEGQVMDNYETSTDLEGIGFFISKELLDNVIKEFHDRISFIVFMREHPVFHLSDKETEEFKIHYDFLCRKISQTDHRYREEVVRSALTTMAYDMASFVTNFNLKEKPQKRRAEVIFEKYIHLVETHFREKRVVEWYADQLFLSSKYLSEAVRKASERTPLEWINMYTALEIRLMLKNTKLDIKEIARLMNFSNQSAMGKFFKTQVGMSPSEYRKS